MDDWTDRWTDRLNLTKKYWWRILSITLQCWLQCTVLANKIDRIVYSNDFVRLLLQTSDGVCSLEFFFYDNCGHLS